MKKINKYLLFSFVIAFITLLITSKNSFLYVFNDWVDANAFFTVGKSMFNKVIIYKDLFEQKGPLLYVIYGIGYLISNKTFYGVFILEIFSFTVFLYFVHKILNIYFDKKYSIVLLPLISFLITTKDFFAQGGSCEEFCLPLIAGSLYYFFKDFKKKKLTNKEIFINGFFAGLVLMMKYTMLGFWIGFGLFIVLEFLKNKEYKKIINFCFIFLLGMIIPFFLFSLYFIMNNAFNEFIEVYFILNMTSYTNVENINIISKIFNILIYSLKILFFSGQLFSLILIVLFLILLKNKNKSFIFSLAGILFTTIFFSFFGLKSYIYYHLPISFLITIFITIILILIFKENKDIFNKLIKFIDKNKIIISIILFFIFLFSLYFCSNNTKYLFKKKEDYVQFKYSNYISKYNNPTLLNMGFLDIGVYTLTGIIPNTRFFEVQNFDYDKFNVNLDEMKKYVKNKEIKFIVYSDCSSINPPSYIYDNYKQVYVDTYKYEGRIYTSYLFELKNL